MNTAELLAEGFGRVRGIVHRVVTGLTPAQLAFRTDAEANSIAWLVWHLTRIQDDHVADVAGLEQVWTAPGGAPGGASWCERFALPFDAAATGYGQTSDEVGTVRAGPADLLGYHDAVDEQTLRYVARISDADLDRIVDESWDPPVSLGVRLVSVITDDLAHAGQAAYVRGLVERAERIR